ncbi:baculoviral IAP repeat-containing protein 2-like isoform X4 [Ostrea edulis]|uniref:baculoviral IAP repeat-containing protein 2-like isoform X4 n=1 Tax=Ostrea edulis TaxID=37623 RepID=UPI0020942A5E|nr:baculoviral IAP repeat-containing protein 2-like isoform X4 [Ostrea edulis]
MAHGQHTSRVKHIAYASVKTRILSFDSAPEGLKILKDKLASAGYFYQGYNTKTSCFACGADHENWSESDDPVQEHFKDNPNCSHVLMMKHKSELRNRSQEPNYTPPKTVSTARYPEFSSLSIRTASFNEADGHLKLNASRIALCGLYYKGYEDRVQCYHCGTEMSITSHDDPTEKHARLSRDCELLRHEIQTLNEDVDRIRNQLQCKVCLNAQVMMTFRPCGHLATCQACADQLSVCPICRSDISDRVKTYF